MANHTFSSPDAVTLSGASGTPLITVILASRSRAESFSSGEDSETVTEESSSTGGSDFSASETENDLSPEKTAALKSGQEQIPFLDPEDDAGAVSMQIIRVQEEDRLHPKHESLKAIREAAGKYLLFLDEGDVLSPGALQLMVKAVSGRKICFVYPAHKGIYSIETEGNAWTTDYSVNIHSCFTLFPTSLHGILFPASAFKKAAASVTDALEEEKKILLALLERNPVFARMGTVTVNCAHAQEQDYLYCLQSLEESWYEEPLRGFLLPLLREKTDSLGYVPRFYQFFALYMLQVRFKANFNNRNKHVYPPEKVPAYCDLFSDIMQYIDSGTVLTGTCLLTDVTLRDRFLGLRLKHRDFSWYPDLVCTSAGFRFYTDGIQFGDSMSLAVNINLIDYIDGCLEIDGSTGDYFREENTQLSACFDGKYYPVVYNRRYSLSKTFGVTYAHLKTFHVSVPIPPGKGERILAFYLKADGMSRKLEYTFSSHTSRFAKDFNYGSWRFGSYMAFWQKTGIHIVPHSALRAFKKEIGLIGQLWKRGNGAYRDQIPLELVNFLLRPYFSRKKVWLFFDKIYKGGDSSEYLYKYTLQKKDGILKYYLLDPSSADYSRMKREGYRPLRRGSLKHRLIFLNSTMVIASNSTVFAFNDYNLHRSMAIRSEIRFDTACVQHGMSVQKIAIAQNRLRDNTKLYFCASPYEIKNLSHPVYDYADCPYPCLHLTGVPRYDGLKDRAEKIILISPTWRMQSAMPVTKSESVERDYNPNFRNTDYFHVYNSLINDPRLLAAARKYGYRIQYVLHPIVSPQADDFDKNDSVEIIPAIGDMSYEKLFCEAALMVTDFSGVQFDFAYMRKPVVYLHHNDIPQHYEEGSFFYDTMGFGEICHTNEELISVLCRYMENDCKMPQIYRERADDFFAFSDNNNCERIYPLMIEHEKWRDRNNASVYSSERKESV